MKFFLSLLITAIILLSVNCLLYNEIAGVNVLDGETLDQIISQPDSDSIWIIHFFSHWCGTCQAFLPKWMKVLATVQNWAPIVRTAVLDCAPTEYTDICRKYKVIGYPSVRVYWPAVSGEVFHDFGNMFPFTYKEVLIRISKASLTMISDAALFSLVPSSMYYMLSSELGSEYFWDHYSSAIPHNLLIVESEKDISKYGAIGPIACLNTSTLNSVGVVHVRYTIVDDVFPETVRDLLASTLHLRSSHGKNSDIKFPMLIELNPSKHTAREVLATGRDHIFSYFDHLIDRYNTEIRVARRRSDRVEAWLPEQDLYKAVYQMVRGEMGMYEKIEADKLTAFKNLFRLIVRYVPFPTKSIREAVRQLYYTILTNAKTTVTADEWLEYLKVSKLPIPQPWKHCKGSRPQYRGYTCGLWLLFHTITANAAFDVDTVDQITVFPAIRDYVTNVFGCRGCAENFKLETANYLNTTDRSAYLVMWKIHNSVNARLAGAVTEDPRSPKIPYPSIADCPLCRLETDGESDWEQKSVMAFLRLSYSADAIIPIEFEEKVEYDKALAI